MGILQRLQEAALPEAMEEAIGAAGRFGESYGVRAEEGYHKLRGFERQDTVDIHVHAGKQRNNAYKQI